MQRRVEEALRAVGAWTDAETDSLQDRWAAVHQAAEAAHALRAPLVAAHTSWTITQALSRAMHQDQ